MEMPRIHYVSSPDGARIAYTVFGSGPPLLFVHPYLGGGIDIRLTAEGAAAFHQALAEHRRLILLDWRGSGLSGTGNAVTVDRLVGDIAGVVDSLDVEKFDVFSALPPCFLAMEYAARHPARIGKLILARPYPPAAGRVLWEGFLAGRVTWEFFTQAISLELYGWNDAAKRTMEQVRSQWTPESFGAFISAVEPLYEGASVASLQCETLVIASEADGEGSRRASQKLASDLVNGQLLVTKLGEFFWDSGLPELIEAFLEPPERQRGVSEPADLPEGAVVILFTDIVESTVLTERLGDAAFRARARELDASLRTLVRESAGTPVEGTLLGDGLLAVFTSARQAIDCALKCNAAAESAGLQLHLGLHAGDVLREGNNVYGGAVNIAARIMGLTAPGQVLVSDTVRSLARTSAGVTFADQGEHSLKGIADPVRVFEVQRQE